MAKVRIQFSLFSGRRWQKQDLGNSFQNKANVELTFLNNSVSGCNEYSSLPPISAVTFSPLHCAQLQAQPIACIFSTSGGEILAPPNASPPLPKLQASSAEASNHCKVSHFFINELKPPTLVNISHCSQEWAESSAQEKNCLLWIRVGIFLAISRGFDSKTVS